MPSVTIKGSLIPFLQSQSWDFDPQRGYIHRMEFRGASQDQMLFLQQDFVKNGISCRLVYQQGDTATLEVDDSTQANLIDVWELVGNEESRDGLSHPTVLGIIPLSITEATIGQMRSDLEANETTASVYNALLAASYPADLAATLARFYSLQQRGSGEYRRQQYVLRHTTNTPNRWNSNVSDVGVDAIYTTAQLISEISNGALWVFPCPGRLQYKISNIPVPSAQAGYLWGWLKGASTETTGANNRVNICTEYSLEQWSTDYYVPY